MDKAYKSYKSIMFTPDEYRMILNGIYARKHTLNDYMNTHNVNDTSYNKDNVENEINKLDELYAKVINTYNGLI